MSMYAAPYCLRCSCFRKSPQFIGDPAACSQYPQGIPKKIFFQAGRCKKTPDNPRENEFWGSPFEEDK